MQIEEGKFYRTRDGRKVGPAKLSDDRRATYSFVLRVGDKMCVFQTNGIHGSKHVSNVRDNDLIAEWVDGPVVTETVTKTSIVPGIYGRIEVDGSHGEYVNLRFITESGKSSGIWSFREDELDAASAVLSALAKGLRDA